jgi:transcriptional regulator with XRE-family HTH domain
MIGVFNRTMKDDGLRKAFGTRLRDLRLQKGWSQKELAGKLGVKLSIFTKYEMGLHLPPPEKLIELSELFDNTVDYLLTGDHSEIAPLHNRRLLERFQALESFQNEDQEAVIRLLDAMIMKQKVQGLFDLPK